MHVQPAMSARDESSAASAASPSVSVQHVCARLDQPMISSLLGFWRLFLMRVIQHMRKPSDAARIVIAEAPNATFGIAR